MEACHCLAGHLFLHASHLPVAEPGLRRVLPFHQHLQTLQCHWYHLQLYCYGLYCLYSLPLCWVRHQEEEAQTSPVPVAWQALVGQEGRGVLQVVGPDQRGPLVVEGAMEGLMGQQVTRGLGMVCRLRSAAVAWMSSERCRCHKLG